MMVAMVSDPTDLVVICCFQLWIPTHQYIRFYCPCVCNGSGMFGAGLEW